VTIQEIETCTLLRIGVWHLKSRFPIAVVGWEMCKTQSVGFPLVCFFQAVRAVCLSIIIWWIRHCGTKRAFLTGRSTLG